MDRPSGVENNPFCHRLEQIWRFKCSNQSSDMVVVNVCKYHQVNAVPLTAETGQDFLKVTVPRFSVRPRLEGSRRAAIDEDTLGHVAELHSDQNAVTMVRL